jgi:hypothetical protein
MLYRSREVPGHLHGDALRAHAHQVSHGRASAVMPRPTRDTGCQTGRRSCLAERADPGAMLLREHVARDGSLPLSRSASPCCSSSTRRSSAVIGNVRACPFFVVPASSRESFSKSAAASSKPQPAIFGVTGRPCAPSPSRIFSSSRLAGRTRVQPASAARVLCVSRSRPHFPLKHRPCIRGKAAS